MRTHEPEVGQLADIFPLEIYFPSSELSKTNLRLAATEAGKFISTIRSIELRVVDDLVDFVRGPGFVLDFSDASFSDFFASELKVNINDSKYAVNGGSKGKRLRYFLQSCDDATAARALTALWEHRSEYLARSGGKDPVVNAEARYQRLINRLSGGATSPPTASNVAASVMDRKKIAKIKADLLQVTLLSPQTRGYAFEVFLKSLFDAFGLAAQEPFRLRGEQIDGSFQLNSFPSGAARPRRMKRESGVPVGVSSTYDGVGVGNEVGLSLVL